MLIDACPGCRGVWLDRGELDKILVRERQMASHDADDDFLREVEGRRPGHDRDERDCHERDRHERDRYDDVGGRRKRRRRSFLEELLDFD